MGQSKWRQRAAHFACLAALIGLTGCVGCPTRGPIQYTSDTLTTHRVHAALKEKYPHVQPAIYVKTFDHVVSLSGAVNSPEEKEQVVAAAQRVSGVRAVLDYIQIKKPAPEQKT